MRLQAKIFSSICLIYRLFSYLFARKVFRRRRGEDKELDPGMEELEPMVVLQAALEVVETEREEV